MGLDGCQPTAERCRPACIQVSWRILGRQAVALSSLHQDIKCRLLLSQKGIAPRKEYGVYGDLIIFYPKPYSFNLRGTVSLPVHARVTIRTALSTSFGGPQSPAPASLPVLPQYKPTHPHYQSIPFISYNYCNTTYWEYLIIIEYMGIFFLGGAGWVQYYRERDFPTHMAVVI